MAEPPLGTLMTRRRHGFFKLNPSGSTKAPFAKSAARWRREISHLALDVSGTKNCKVFPGLISFVPNRNDCALISEGTRRQDKLRNRAEPRSSSVRSGMSIVNTWRKEKSPVGASCPVFMPLLTELRDFVFLDIYKHAAPL